MDKISLEGLPFLYDEPIYVLKEHGDHPNSEAEKVKPVAFKGKNLKGIAIFHESTSSDDLVFLFKGLNALEIFEDDIALINHQFDSGEHYPKHTIRLIFSNSAPEDRLFKVEESNGVRELLCTPLGEIQKSLELKKTFWLALKELFNK